MSDKWIVDILSDIATFAEANGMSQTTEMLLDTMLVASSELTRQDRFHDYFLDSCEDVVTLRRPTRQ